MSKPQVGIQLYSVRDLSEKDFAGTIRQIAAIGYKHVELAGYYGLSAKALRVILQDAGLQAPAAHVGLGLEEAGSWQDRLKEQAEYAAELGLRWFIVPSYRLPDNPVVEDVERMAAILEEASDIVAAYGLGLGYHNHAYEFRAVAGKPAIDRVLEQVPAGKLIAEFDLGWVKMAGQDPAAYVDKYAGRVPIVHAKDFRADGTDTEIGSGIVDWDAVLAACERAGVEYVIIEQEKYEVGSLHSARLNFSWFRNRGWV
jgi:sugar phosphate isomerase/epimerase